MTCLQQGGLLVGEQRDSDAEERLERSLEVDQV